MRNPSFVLSSLLCLGLFIGCGDSGAPTSGGSETESGDGDTGDGDGEGGTVDGTGDGDGDSGDGDGDSGDGDGDSGDGDGDTGDGDGDGDLEPICTQGCMHVFDCAAMEAMMYYPDVPACVAACQGLWGACVPEGSTYIYCTLGLECPDVVTLLVDG